jgi:hypothetical protein
MFNEGSGATVPDRIGGKDLTLQSATWTTQSGMTCVNLSGSSQWLDTAAWTVGANNVTMVGWFYFPTAVISSQMMLIEKETVNAQWELLFNLGYGVRGGGTTTCGGDPPSVNTWHQLGATINGTSAVVYTDGADISSGGCSVDAFTDTSSVLEIGRFNSGFYYNGKVGPVYIYNRAITAAEMAQLYAAVYLY